jgi:hypothetical protein
MSVTCYIEREPRSRMISIHLFEKHDQNISEYHFSEKGGIHTLNEIKSKTWEEEGLPTFQIPRDLYDILAKSILEDLESKGYKSESDFKILGKLEAKQEHLQDIREINTKLFSLLDKTNTTN